jgi:probable HAF family extracellular repeat protein
MKVRCAALSTVTFLLVSTFTFAQDYSLVPVPAFGTHHSRAIALSESGWITGGSLPPTGQSQAFVWSRSGGLQNIGLPGSASSSGNAVSGNGKVAGIVQFARQTGFWWDPSTGGHELDVPNQIANVATGINNSGEVVGYYVPVEGPDKGFTWTKSAGFHYLDDLGCVGCLPNAISDTNLVIGALPQPDGSQHAFAWSLAKGLIDLGTLGGPNSTAVAVNRAGQVVGHSDTADGSQHGFFWSRTTGMLDIGILAGHVNSWGNAIDASGRVVGSSWGPGNNDGTPFSWTLAGGLQALGPYNLKFSSADGVNTAGQILLSYYGYGYVSYLLTPVMHTALAVTPNPAKVGQPITFVATVSSAVHAPPPDGELVNFLNAGAVIATAPLQAGVATLVMPLPKSLIIVAQYAGDSNYASSKSKAVSVVVQK